MAVKPVCFRTSLQSVQGFHAGRMRIGVLAVGSLYHQLPGMTDISLQCVLEVKIKRLSASLPEDEYIYPFPHG